MKLTKENIVIVCNDFFLENQDVFLVEIKMSPRNDIYIRIDGDKGVNIEKCTSLSRKIESAFDREEEDYSLEVSSYDIMAPLILERQYKKNEGRILKIITLEGKEVIGNLVEYNIEDKMFYIEKIKNKEKISLKLDEIKTINIRLKF